jgi:hypothetical protein
MIGSDWLSLCPAEFEVVGELVWRPDVVESMGERPRGLI